MKYGLGLRLLISFCVGGLAVLYKLRMGTSGSVSQTSVLIEVPQQFLFDVVSEPSNVPLWFSWITKLRSADKRRAVFGKRFRGILNMPFLGQHEISYKIVDCQDGSWIVLRPEKKEKSYFNTEVALILSSVSKSQTQFHMKITYGRNSALFKYTIGPILKWLTDKQMEKIGTSIRTLALSRWRKLSGVKPASVLDDINSNDIPHGMDKLLHPQSMTSSGNKTYYTESGIPKTSSQNQIGSVRKYGEHTEL